MFYRRNLPHWIPPDATIFLTFRLAGSLPATQTTKGDGLCHELCHKPQEQTKGPFWLLDDRVAAMVSEAVIYGEEAGYYELFAWVVMPNHVHLLIRPVKDLARITQWIKGRTARVGNRILRRSGAFWQDESFDRWIRSWEEFQGAVDYIETNPVKSGLTETPQAWKWSSGSSITDHKKRWSVPLLPTQHQPTH
jgi:REP element-mobilizing transposase RayT